MTSPFIRPPALCLSSHPKKVLYGRIKVLLAELPPYCFQEARILFQRLGSPLCLSLIPSHLVVSFNSLCLTGSRNPTAKRSSRAPWASLCE